ncbi:MAG: DUF742 domain-containing protein [Kibdelosporangium sp.]
MTGRADDPDVTLVRPYLLTSGRTRPVDHTLEIEAQVMTSRLGAASHPDLTFERRDIISLCRRTRSVAEVAAMLKLHIGVTRVLVADLAALGYVVIRRPQAEPRQDLRMIERVIRGLESLR